MGEEKYVTFEIFQWTIGIVTLLFIGLFGIQLKLINDVSKVNTNLAVSQRDISWIRSTLSSGSGLGGGGGSDLPK